MQSFADIQTAQSRRQAHSYSDRLPGSHRRVNGAFDPQAQAVGQQEPPFDGLPGLAVLVPQARDFRVARIALHRAVTSSPADRKSPARSTAT